MGGHKYPAGKGGQRMRFYFLSHVRSFYYEIVGVSADLPELNRLYYIAESCKGNECWAIIVENENSPT